MKRVVLLTCVAIFADVDHGLCQVEEEALLSISLR